MLLRFRKGQTKGPPRSQHQQSGGYTGLPLPSRSAPSASGRETPGQEDARPDARPRGGGYATGDLVYGRHHRLSGHRSEPKSSMISRIWSARDDTASGITGRAAPCHKRDPAPPGKPLAGHTSHASGTCVRDVCPILMKTWLCSQPELTTSVRDIRPLPPWPHWDMCPCPSPLIWTKSRPPAVVRSRPWLIGGCPPLSNAGRCRSLSNSRGLSGRDPQGVLSVSPPVPCSTGTPCSPFAVWEKSRDEVNAGSGQRRVFGPAGFGGCGVCCFVGQILTAREKPPRVLGMRDRGGLDARPVAVDRDHSGVDTRPGCGVLPIPLIPTTWPLTVPQRIREQTHRGVGATPPTMMGGR